MPQYDRYMNNRDQKILAHYYSATWQLVIKPPIITEYGHNVSLDKAEITQELALLHT